MSFTQQNIISLIDSRFEEFKVKYTPYKQFLQTQGFVKALSDQFNSFTSLESKLQKQFDQYQARTKEQIQQLQNKNEEFQNKIYKDQESYQKLIDQQLSDVNRQYSLAQKSSSNQKQHIKPDKLLEQILAEKLAKVEILSKQTAFIQTDLLQKQISLDSLTESLTTNIQMEFKSVFDKMSLLDQQIGQLDKQNQVISLQMQAFPELSVSRNNYQQMDRVSKIEYQVKQLQQQADNNNSFIEQFQRDKTVLQIASSTLNLSGVSQQNCSNDLVNIDEIFQKHDQQLSNHQNKIEMLEDQFSLVDELKCQILEQKKLAEASALQLYQLKTVVNDNQLQLSNIVENQDKMTDTENKFQKQVTSENITPIIKQLDNVDFVQTRGKSTLNMQENNRSNQKISISSKSSRQSIVNQQQLAITQPNQSSSFTNVELQPLFPKNQDAEILQQLDQQQVLHVSTSKLQSFEMNKSVSQNLLNQSTQKEAEPIDDIQQFIIDNDKFIKCQDNIFPSLQLLTDFFNEVNKKLILKKLNSFTHIEQCYFIVDDVLNKYLFDMFLNINDNFDSQELKNYNNKQLLISAIKQFIVNQYSEDIAREFAFQFFENTEKCSIYPKTKQALDNIIKLEYALQDIEISNIEIESFCDKFLYCLLLFKLMNYQQVEIQHSNGVLTTEVIQENDSILICADLEKRWQLALLPLVSGDEEISVQLKEII